MHGSSCISVLVSCETRNSPQTKSIHIPSDKRLRNSRKPQLPSNSVWQRLCIIGLSGLPACRPPVSRRRSGWPAFLSQLLPGLRGVTISCSSAMTNTRCPGFQDPLAICGSGRVTITNRTSIICQHSTSARYNECAAFQLLVAKSNGQGAGELCSSCRLEWGSFRSRCSHSPSDNILCA